MDSAPRVTSHDVAQRAGVAQSTVSLVLSGKSPGRVSEAVQNRVRAAAAELDYQPSRTARALRIGRTRAVGLLVPDVTNPFLGLVMHGAQRAAAQAGLTAVLLEYGREPADHLAAAEALRGGLVDGLLLFGVPPDPAAPLPVPATLVEVEAQGLPAVLLDSRGGMRAVAEHVVAAGHRRLGYVGLADARWTFERRRRHWRAALAACGAEVTVREARAAELTIDAAREAALPLLHEQPPTAIVCADDILAAGVYAAAAALAVRIPEDLSVVGYSGTIVGEALAPGLTTVHAPAGELGGRAVHVLIDVLSGRSVPRRTTLPVQLLQRGSMGAPAR